MKRTKEEQKMRQEFSDFIDTEQIAPGKHLDEAVLSRVKKDLQPAWWMIYGKLTLIQVTAGLATLTICPQFGFGFGQHNQFLHDLHLATSPIVFYLLCGLFFVILGATLGGLILNRAEIRTLGDSKYLYFAVYSILAFLILLSLGTEAFIASSMVWMLGAFLGNVFGFAAGIRFRHAISR